MTKARGGGNKGAAYIDALLVGFNDTPEKNSVFPNITMPPPFAKGDPEIARKAKDVSAFLDYAAEPSERERRDLGGYVLGYMVLLTGLLYALNRRTWKGIGKTPS
jgi:cytochrome c1